MRFGRVLVEGDPDPVGVVRGEDGRVHSLHRPLAELVAEGLPALLEFGALALTTRPWSLDGSRLLAPIVPASVRDFVAFEEHVVGVRRSVDGASGVPEQWYAAPTFYFTNPHAIYGPGDEIARPELCRALDFELEVAAVIGGAGGSSLSEEQAREAIVGYTIFNDFSARDLQSAEMKVGLGPAKGKDFASSLGPWLVTVDELESYRDADGFLDLDCRVEVNGIVVGGDSLANMGWTFETMVAYASRDSLVLPGDVLASGTTGGGGCLAELWGRSGTQEPPPLQPGDIVTITVGGLGSLTNTIVAGAPVPALTPFRRATDRRG